jgi:hypothetical protein
MVHTKLITLTEEAHHIEQQIREEMRRWKRLALATGSQNTEVLIVSNNDLYVLMVFTPEAFSVSTSKERDASGSVGEYWGSKVFVEHIEQPTYMSMAEYQAKRVVAEVDGQFHVGNSLDEDWIPDEPD